MFDLSTLLALLGASIALALLPGPSSMLILSRSISGGRVVGLATCLGSLVGSLGVVLAAALGLSALLMASDLAFGVVKIAGAVYLVYIGIRTLLDKHGLAAHAVAPITPRQAFVQGLLTDLLNPKTALFFTAFLPQFIHHERGLVTLQFIVLGFITVGVLVIYATTLAISASSVRAWLLRHPGFVRVQSRIVGCLFIGLGLRLALARRE
ncbi:MAG: LysE family translocator [Thermaceae bacterium]|nr:LysE family translocator [Thermaceae bacterium]